ncbi:hypothetical protein OOK27_21790 [Streptomyces canus]|uniref:hypothetical protein n=1 Tax=Streptomyces canus TaxID=58343 RepID=UPI0022508E3C|nr:hypothetical protein [Streptomyces canus]MCX5256735.1 hypothetical protein [Streptomyces canus]
MTPLQLLALLLALSVALHIGSVTAFAAWRSGTTPAKAILIGGSATGSACGLYFAAVSAYH